MSRWTCLVPVVLTGLFGCDSDGDAPRCSVSVDACQVGESCSITYGQCSDGTTRELECVIAEAGPFDCRCIENDVVVKSAGLDRLPANVADPRETAESACGWTIR